MLTRSLRAALLVGAAVLTPAAAITMARVPAVPPDPCRVEARIAGQVNTSGQYPLEIRLPASCPANRERLARIVTRLGGRLPPIGHFRLGAGFPRSVRYWVFKGARVLDRPAPNVWNEVPIQGAPWQP